MHVDVVFQADGRVAYTGDGVVEERVSLLEGLEVLCGEGIVHVDFLGSRIDRSQPRNQSLDFRPFFVGGVDCFIVVSLGRTHNAIIN